MKNLVFMFVAVAAISLLVVTRPLRLRLLIQILSQLLIALTL